MNVSGGRAADPSPRKPPYASMTGVRKALQHLRASGVPDRIRYSDLGLKPSTARQVIAALKSLHLLTEKGAPTVDLHRVLRDKAGLGSVLRRQYPKLVQLIESGADPDRVEIEFRAIIGERSPSQAKRFRSLVLGALMDAGMDAEVYQRRRQGRVKLEYSGPASYGSGLGHREERTGTVSSTTARKQGDLYLKMLGEAIERGDHAGAEWIAQQLRNLRSEGF